MSFTKFIENNIDKLIQIYVNETKFHSNTNTQRGILLIDFRNQVQHKVDVNYVELHQIPEDIRKTIEPKLNDPLYSSVLFFCVLRPDNTCFLLDINLDEARNKYFDGLHSNEICREQVEKVNDDNHDSYDSRKNQTYTQSSANHTE
tara:strand:+ start:1012 stop:1449 length:438 start_codon:yes stop_codon:yes gene_type:complete